MQELAARVAEDAVLGEQAARRIAQVHTTPLKPNHLSNPTPLKPYTPKPLHPYHPKPLKPYTPKIPNP